MGAQDTTDLYSLFKSSRQDRIQGVLSSILKVRGGKITSQLGNAVMTKSSGRPMGKAEDGKVRICLDRNYCVYANQRNCFEFSWHLTHRFGACYIRK